MNNTLAPNLVRRSRLTHSNEVNPYVAGVTKISGRAKQKPPLPLQNAAASKIQQKYRCYKNKKNFNLYQKQKLKNQGDDFINSQLALCERGGPVIGLNDYHSEGWRNFYSSNDTFFTGYDYWRRRPIFNSVIIQNPDNPSSVSVYEGEVDIYNRKNGFGQLTTSRDIKVGTWRDNNFTGWNKECQRNGPSIEGRFTDGYCNGKGTMVNPKGDVYTGDFHNSQRQGVGELRSRRFEYSGDFYNNKMDGKGRIRFIQNGETYEGDFKNNQINGVGTFKWPNGDVYTGEMVDGKRSGNGKYVYANNQIYEGTYRDGKKAGSGTLKYDSRRSLQSNFWNGKPQGSGRYINNGDQMNVRFEDGKAYYEP